ncbi:MAG: FmdB family zinc ribbon protein [Candidatus Humimicrobiaceae bacterium]
MAIYSYICGECGEKFDLYMGTGGEKDKLTCKNCGSKNIKKDFSSIGCSIKKDNGSSSSCATGTCSFN